MGLVESAVERRTAMTRGPECDTLSRVGGVRSDLEVRTDETLDVHEYRGIGWSSRVLADGHRSSSCGRAGTSPATDTMRLAPCPCMDQVRHGVVPVERADTHAADRTKVTAMDHDDDLHDRLVALEARAPVDTTPPALPSRRRL